MSSKPTMAANNGAPVQAAKRIAPPEEQFWKKYSPHHEMPLSASSSFALHGLIFAVIIGIGYLSLRMREANNSLPVEAIVIAGGGGSPDGFGNTAPGDARPVENVGNSDKTPESKPVASNVPPEVLTPVPVDPLTIDLKKTDGTRYIDASNEAMASLSKVNEEARKKLWQGIGPGKGQGGSGSGGGKGKGKGKGEGDLEGDGKSNISNRQKRVLRWTLNFDTLNGEDYRRQLSALGAILAIPDQDGKYKVFRDLKGRNAKGAIEDIAEIKRIFWVDDRPDSVAQLAMALGIQPRPQIIVAFFPEEFEAELLKKELAFRGKKEEDIKGTRFRVQNMRAGKYVAIVESQD